MTKVEGKSSGPQRCPFSRAEGMAAPPPGHPALDGKAAEVDTPKKKPQDNGYGEFDDHSGQDGCRTPNRLASTPLSPETPATMTWAPDDSTKIGDTAGCFMKRFGLAEDKGFVPAELPLRRLPEIFASWESIVEDLSALLAAKALRPRVENLPLLDAALLQTECEKERGFLVLALMTQAYVWGEVPVAEVLPQCIAVPFATLAASLDRPPILAHRSIVLENYRLLDHSLPPRLGNVATLNQFLGGMDEAWFYLVTLEVEVVGAPCVASIVRAQEAVLRNDASSVHLLKNELCIMEEHIRDMARAVNRMHERCMPEVFYERIRPFLSGTKGGQALPNGILFQGYGSEHGTRYCLFGGSAAQSPLPQALDIGLNISHNASTTTCQYLRSMRTYMQREHREFLEALEKGPSVRDFVSQNMADVHLAEVYDRCIEAMAEFRSSHMALVSRYILQQVNKAAATPTKPVERSSSQHSLASTTTDLVGSASDDDTSSVSSEGASVEAAAKVAHGGMIESVDTNGEKQALGTGGTSIISFLKETKAHTLSSRVMNSRSAAMHPFWREIHASLVDTTQF
jgi:indoleamine 2,3-dioxygenase